MRIRVLLLAGWFILQQQSVRASCGSSSCPIDLHALDDVSGSRFIADLSFEYIDQDELKHGEGSGDVEIDHQEIRTINRLTTLQLSWLLSPRIQLSMATPFVSRSHEHVDLESGGPERWQFSGLGDVMVHGRFAAVEGDGATRPSLWLTAGLSLPTGEQHEVSRGPDPEEAEVTLQPGDGSTDALVGVSLQGNVLRNTAMEGELGGVTLIPYFISAVYRINGSGTYDYRKGNEFQLNTGTEYPLTSSLHALAQMNLRYSAKDDTGTTGENRDLTGGTHLYLSPGLRLALGERASIYAFVQLPVYERVNGIQLTSSANYLAGVQKRF